MAQSLEDAKLRIIIDASTSRDSMKRGEERAAASEKKRREDAERGEKAQRRRFGAGPGRRGGGLGGGPGRGRFGKAASTLAQVLIFAQLAEVGGRAIGGGLEELGDKGIPLAGPLGRAIQKIVTEVITKQKFEIGATFAAIGDAKSFVAAMKAAGVNITSAQASEFFAVAKEINKAEAFGQLARDTLTSAQVGPVAVTAIGALLKQIGNLMLQLLVSDPQVDEEVRKKVREEMEKAGNPKIHR